MGVGDFRIGKEVDGCFLLDLYFNLNLANNCFL